MHHGNEEAWPEERQEGWPQDGQESRAEEREEEQPQAQPEAREALVTPSPARQQESRRTAPAFFLTAKLMREASLAKFTTCARFSGSSLRLW